MASSSNNLLSRIENFNFDAAESDGSDGEKEAPLSPPAVASEDIGSIVVVQNDGSAGSVQREDDEAENGENEEGGDDEDGDDEDKEWGIAWGRGDARALSDEEAMNQMLFDLLTRLSTSTTTTTTTTTTSTTTTSTTTTSTTTTTTTPQD